LQPLYVPQQILITPPQIAFVLYISERFKQGFFTRHVNPGAEMFPFPGEHDRVYFFILGKRVKYDRYLSPHLRVDRVQIPGSV
jgi:hypothetical protein